MTFAPADRPKLRQIGGRPINDREHNGLLLRDPLELCEQSVVLPHALIPILEMLDGTHTVAQLPAQLKSRFNLGMGSAQLQQLLAALDNALLLENENSARAQAQAVSDFHALTHRALSSAGGSYPAEPQALRELFNTHLAQAAAEPGTADYRALFSPHIDYGRGHQAYAALWKAGAAAAQHAELVILIGTDHSLGEPELTLTRQNYATPFGVLPTDLDLVDELTGTLGAAAVFAHELHHRGEHSLELVANWLHHMRAGQPVALLPVLVGSLGAYVRGGADIAANQSFEAFIAQCEAVMRSRRTLVVISGDLSHVGPAFDGAPLHPAGKDKLRKSDMAILAAACTGQPERFLASVAAIGDRTNICGVAPLYLGLRLLGASQGRSLAYQHCPADDADTSVVSVCGITFV